MKRLYRLTILIILIFAAGILSPVSARAGRSVQISEPVSADGSLNQTEWYFADSTIESVLLKEAAGEESAVYGLSIPSSEAAGDIGFISKIVSDSNEMVEEMTGVEAVLTFTDTAGGGRAVLAFGLSSIEANSGAEGNVEIVFEIGSDTKAGVTAYTGGEAVVLAQSAPCGIEEGKSFAVSASITPAGVMTVDVNGRRICSSQLPVSGKGRFGVLRSGSAGILVSELKYRCSFYDTPENTNIDEDFERGDLNINELYAASRYNGLDPSYIRIEDWDGNKVLRFRNCGLAHVGTVYNYSNFEISFDIPYFLNENVYDEDGTLIGKPSSNIGVSFGSGVEHPEGYTYVHDVDMIVICPDRLYSYSRKTWRTSLADVGLNDLEKNEGYSFKLTVIDGHSVCQVKRVDSQDWITVGECDYESQRSGHIFIWSTGNSDCTIDNLKITNLDEGARLIDAGFTSSVITAEDYELTEEEKTLTFRPEEPSQEAAEKQGKDEQKAFPGFLMWSGIGAVVLAAAGLLTGMAVKRKKRREVKTDAEK